MVQLLILASRKKLALANENSFSTFARKLQQFFFEKKLDFLKKKDYSYNSI